MACTLSTETRYQFEPMPGDGLERPNAARDDRPARNRERAAASPRRGAGDRQFRRRTSRPPGAAAGRQGSRGQDRRQGRRDPVRAASARGVPAGQTALPPDAPAAQARPARGRSGSIWPSCCASMPPWRRCRPRPSSSGARRTGSARATSWSAMTSVSARAAPAIPNAEQAGAAHGFGVTVVARSPRPARCSPPAPSAPSWPRAMSRARPKMLGLVARDGQGRRRRQARHGPRLSHRQHRASPGHGARPRIYAVRVRRGQTACGAAYLGTRPTFDDGAPMLEVFLLDFDGDSTAARSRWIQSLHPRRPPLRQRRALQAQMTGRLRACPPSTCRSPGPAIAVTASNPTWAPAAPPVGPRFSAAT